MNRQFRFAIRAGAAVALLAQVPAPSWAQKSDVLEQEARDVQERLEFVSDMEGFLKEAEAARLKGDCALVVRWDQSFQAILKSSGPEYSDISADFQRRMREIALRDCPPDSGKPSIALPPAQPAPQSTPAPPTAVPVAPAPVGSVGTPPPQGEGDDILDEIGADTDRTPTGLPPTPIVPEPEPRRTAPPVPPRPVEDIHVVPRPFPSPPPMPQRKPERTPVPPPPTPTPPVVTPAPVGSVGSSGDSAPETTGSRIEEAEKKLEADIKAGRPVNEADYEALLDEAQRNLKAAEQAVKVGLPIDSSKVLGELERAADLVRRARAEEARQAPRTPKPEPTPNTTGAINLSPFARDVLAAHNAARAAVGAASLKWNPALEASATAHAGVMAQAGQLVHAPREGRGIERENLLQAPIGYSTGQMMQRWSGESRYFVPGIYPNVCTGDWSQCAHYSQMIWPTTTDLGCGIVPDGGSNWLVCRYSPGGNKDGKPVGMK